MLTRRQLLMMGAGIGGGLILPTFFKGKKAYGASPTLSKFTESLPISYASAAPSTLTLASSSHSFHSSLGEAPTFGYGGFTYLGPTFEVSRGVPSIITAYNNLGTHPLANSIDTDIHGALASDATNPRSVIHLHGANTEPQSDGYPEDSFLPGQTYTYNYNNNQEAGTFWYHDHTLGATALNLQAGLAGVYLIRDEDDPIGGDGPLGLPSGEPYEIPLIIQDHIFKSDGSIDFHAEWKSEFYGDVAVVNGKAWPNLNVDRTLYRFRIVNASNSRFYRLKLSNNQQIIQIGSDGGFLNSPVYLYRLLIGPGERADVLIDFSSVESGDTIVLQNDAPAPYPKGMSVVINQGYPKISEILQFTVKSGSAQPKPIPNTLRINSPKITDVTATPVRQRYITLTEVLSSSNVVIAMMLNQVYWHEASENADLREQPKVDTLEQWNIINLQPYSHTIHLHLVSFRLLNRQSFNYGGYNAAYTETGPREVRMQNAPGGPVVPADYPPIDPTPYLIGSAKSPGASETGWKDTIVVNPFEVARILVPFGANAIENVPFGNSFTGRYAWHCHMLNHEDNEMMLPYDVVE